MPTEHDTLIAICNDAAMADGCSRRTRGRRIRDGILHTIRINGRLYTTEADRRLYIARLRDAAVPAE